MTINKIKHKKDLKDLKNSFNHGTLKDMSWQNFVVKDKEYVYKKIDDIKTNFEKHISTMLSIINKKKIPKALKDLKKLEVEYNINLDSFKNTIEKIDKLQSDDLPTFEEYLIKIKELSNTYEFINSFEISNNFTRSKLINKKIWHNPNEKYSATDIQKIRNLLDNFSKIPAGDDAFIYWPAVSSENITDEMNPIIIDNKSIMLRPNFPELNKNLIVNSSKTFLLFPIFNFEIDTKLLKILKYIGIPEIIIKYGVRENIKKIFEF